MSEIIKNETNNELTSPTDHENFDRLIQDLDEFNDNPFGDESIPFGENQEDEIGESGEWHPH
jgi:hypothetical protein